MKKFYRSIAAILAVCMLFTMAFTVSATDQTLYTMEILDLTVNNRTNPQGLDDDTPSFGWRMDSNLVGQKQTAYHVIVTEKFSGETMWDSGKVEGNVSQYIEYAGKELSPESDYNWNVTVYDSNGKAYLSDTATFTTGLMADRLIPEEQPSIQDLTSYTIDTDFVIHSGCMGLLFGVQDSNNFYMWQINAGDLSINPHQWSNGGINTNFPHPSIKDALGVDSILETPLHLTMKMEEGTVTSWINDVQIGEPLSIGQVKLGRIGFRQAVNESADIDQITVKDQDGQVVFEEDFSDQTSNPFDGGTVENGQLKMNSTNLVFQKDTELENTTFTIDFDGQVVNTALGPLIGGQDNSNFYMWQINAAERVFKPHQWSGGNITTLKQVSLDPVFGEGQPIEGVPFHMTIQANNGEVKTYLNKIGEQPQLIDTIQLSPFSVGKFGFRQMKDHVSNEVGLIDNLKIVGEDGSILLEDDFSSPYNTTFPSGSITEDGWFCAENGLFFQNETEEVLGWSGAQWIGSPEISVDSGKIPVYNLYYDLQLVEGSTKAAALVCGNDYRLMDKTKNNYRVEGESYLSFELDASNVSAGGSPVLNLYRKGFCSDDYKNPDATTLMRSFSLDNIGVTAENLYTTPIRFSLTCYGGGFRIYVNDQNYGEVVINPTGGTQDQPCYTYLNSIGFLTEPGQQAEFQNYEIRTWDTAHAVMFDKTTGATYSIFEGQDGVSVQDHSIMVGDQAKQVKILAEPDYKSNQLLRKEFNADQPIQSARLYITSRGIYEPYVNGERIGEDWFNPGFTQYNKTITYSTYDITDQLQQGTNAIGVRLASGWWHDEMTFDLSKYNYWGNKPSLLAKVVVTYADGTKDTIVTDESWSYNNTDSPIIYAGFFNGEVYDARKEATIEGWNQPGYTGENWYNASVIVPLPENANPHIIARVDEPVRHVETLSAKFDKEPDPNIYVYDMGTNMVGVPEITFPEMPAGTEITIRYSEIYYPELDPSNPYYYGEMSGKLLTENLRAALCTDTYIAKGTKGGETYRPSFTFHGYRYIEISGLEEPLPEENIKGIVLSSIEGTTSTYESSNELTNQLHKNIQRSLLGNHVSIPTDCPQRDERMGWTGDAQVFSRTATYYGDMNLLYEGWEGTIRDAQTASGTIPQTAPNLGWGASVEVAWPAAIVIPTWEIYKQYGNTRVIESNLDAMKAFLDSIGNDKFAPDSYLTKGTALTEHLALVGTDSPLCSNVLYAYMLGLFSKMAAAIGEDELAQHYSDLSVKVKEEWNQVFINAATGQTQNSSGGIQDTQASYALAIEYNVISDENRDQAAELLDQACERGYNNVPYTITTGFIGTAPLLPALTDVGKVDTAYKMFEQTEFASWLYPVTQGATSIWERWNGYTIENGFSGLNYMNSFNHYAAGAVGAWMMNDHVGITSDEEHPGFQQFILQPTLGGDFTYVNGGYDSIYGHITSNWKANQGKLTAYEAEVPANTTATLYLPMDQNTVIGDLPEGVSFTGWDTRYGNSVAVFQLVAGGYQFSVENNGLTVALNDGYVTEGTPEPPVGDANKTILDKVITEANRLKGTEEYTNAIPAVKESFDKVLADAQAVYDNPSATQKEVDTAWMNLIEEIHKLGFQKGDKTALQELYDQVKDIDLSQYRDGAAKENFKTALVNAETVLADENALQNEIDKAYNDLKSAYEALEKLADKSQLKALLDECAGYQKEEYTPVTWEVFEGIQKKAQEVYDNANATQEEINAAVDELLSGMLQLRFKADKSLLQNLIAELEEMDFSQYTEESVAAFQIVLAEAKTILSDDNISIEDQQIVDQQVSNLKSAYKGLIGKQTDSTEFVDITPSNENSQETKPIEAANTGDVSPIAGLILLGLAGITVAAFQKRK